MDKQYLKQFSLVLLVAISVVVVILLRQESAAPTPGDANTGADAPVQLAPAAGLPRLIELGADKCIPCQQMKPILDSLRADFDDQFGVEFIHVYEEKERAEPYAIRLMPTQVFLNEDGEELFRHEGFFSRDDILAKWREFGYEFASEAGEGTAAETMANAAVDSDFRIEVIYLHPTLRCEACLAAEKHAEAALHEFFQADIDSGFLRWAAFNLEEGPGGTKYAKRFGVEEGSALILAEYIGNEPGRWQELDRVLEVGMDRDATIGYLTTALSEFVQQCELPEPATETGP
jgi:thioredoxin